MTTHILKKISRAQLPAGESLCDYCTAKCCRYYAISIPRPRQRSDFDVIRWYLLHEHTGVFVEDNAWYVIVYSVCKKLQSDHRCGIYHTRPEICREYTTDECEFDDDWTYEQYFETAEQLEEYCEARFAQPGDMDFRSAKPDLLPIIQ